MSHSSKRRSKRSQTAQQPSLEGARRALLEDPQAPSAQVVRAGSDTRGAADGRGAGHLPGLLEESHHRRDACSSCCNWRRNPACARRIDAMFRGEKINITENRAVLHVALRAPEGTVDLRGWRRRGAAGPRGARQDGGLLRAGPQRRMEGPHGQADSQRGQHRHRRLRSGTGDGV